MRGWAVVATAILAGAAADAVTEFAADSGWLAGAVRDDQHEAVVPALLLGAIVALALTLFVLFARISLRDPLLSQMNDLRRRLLDFAGAFFGSSLCVVAMEGYETRFGGLSPFDPRSVVLSHAPALVVAFAVAAAIVHYALRAAIRTASRANVVVEYLVEFLRRLLGAAPGHRTLAPRAFEPRVIHVALGIAGGVRGRRAPPRSIRPHLFAA